MAQAQLCDIAQKLFDNHKEVTGIFANDVKILASDGEVQAHKSVLGARSPYFESSINQLLATDPQLQVQKVTLDETSFTQDVLECLIRYIYLPGEEPTILDISRLEKIFEASSKFERGEFTEKYLQQLIKSAGQLITKDNWLTWFTLGVKLVGAQEEEYFNQIYLFLGQKYPEFYSSEEFLKLSIEDLRIMLNSVNRPFKSGTDDLLRATFKWVGSGDSKRSEFSEEFIKLWRDHQNSATSSTSGPNHKDNNNVNKKSLENGNDNRRKRILEADTQSMDSQNEDSDNDDGVEINQKSKKFKMEGRARLIDSIESIEIDDDDEIGNTYSSEFDTDTDSDQEFSQDTQQLLFFGKYKKSYRLCSYDLDTNLLSRVALMPIKGLKNMSLMTDLGTAKIYCLGGKVGSRIENSVHSFLINELGTFRNEPWKRELKMELSSKRKDFASIIVDDILYVLGGNDGMTENSIEKMGMFHKRQGWSKAEMTMNYYRELFDVADFNNIIYIAGGYGKRHIESVSDALKSAEAYNIETEEVSGLPLMNIARVDLRLIAYNWKIYAIGGYHYYQGNEVKLASVEVLDIRNIAKGWTLGPSLTKERAGGYAFVSDDSIYYIGGDTLDSDDGDDASYTMEKLDIKRNEWEIVDSNLPKIADFSSCAILN